MHHWNSYEIHLWLRWTPRDEKMWFNSLQHTKQRRSTIFYRKLWNQQFSNIYASWTFLGYPFLRKWCHRRLRYIVFELPFVSWDVEAGHKSTRMYIDFYSKPQRVSSDFNWWTTDILIRGIVSTRWYHCPKPWRQGFFLQKFKLPPKKSPTNPPPNYVPPKKPPTN